MQTTYLQRQIALLLKFVAEYSSGERDFNEFYHNAKALILLVKENDNQNGDYLEDMLMNMDFSYATRKFRGNLDEEEFRRSQAEVVQEMQSYIAENFKFE